MLVSEVLDRAADLTEKHGNCKGKLLAPTGEYCARGAIMKACNIEPDWGAWGIVLGFQTHDVRNFWRAERSLGTALGLDPLDMNAVPTWNNQHERTQDEVIAALRAAALQERMKEQCAKSTCEQPTTSSETAPMPRTRSPRQWLSEWKSMAASPIKPTSDTNSTKPCETTSAWVKPPSSSAIDSDCTKTTSDICV